MVRRNLRCGDRNARKERLLPRTGRNFAAARWQQTARLVAAGARAAARRHFRLAARQHELAEISVSPHAALYRRARFNLGWRLQRSASPAALYISILLPYRWLSSAGRRGEGGGRRRVKHRRDFGISSRIGSLLRRHMWRAANAAYELVSALSAMAR